MNPRLKEQIRKFLPRIVKSHRILSGPLKNASIYCSWHDYPGALLGTTESPLLSWFSKNVRAGETWLDIGAHYGYTALMLSRLVGETGRVFAFEPVLSSAGAISKTREANSLLNLTVVPFGLNDSPSLELVTLPTVRGMADSTLTGEHWHETITCSAFDKLWNCLSGGNGRVDGVKIDVQGMEASVLSGMRELLSAQRPKLVLEFHNGVNRKGILELLSACGYASPIVSVDSGLEVGEHECHDDRSFVFRPLTCAR